MPSRSSFADSATGRSKRKDTIARDVMEVICEIGICSPEVEKVVEVIEEEEKGGGGGRGRARVRRNFPKKSETSVE